MKTLLLLTLPVAVLGYTTVQGQDVANAAPVEPQTKLEAFVPAAGSVTIIGYDELGESGAVSVNVRELKDQSGASARGLVVQVTESEYRKASSFVDADEIPELLNGLDVLLAVKDNPTQFDSFEVHYKTKGGVEIAAFNNDRGAINYQVKCGQTVSAATFLSADRLQKLKALFESAQVKLDSLE